MVTPALAKLTIEVPQMLLAQTAGALSEFETQETYLVHTLKGLAKLGTEWVLWTLVALSVISVAIVIERFIFYARGKLNADTIAPLLVQYLNQGDFPAALDLVENKKGADARILVQGLRNHEKGPLVVEELMNAEAIGQKARLDRFLIFLASVGSNAPFIGLLGTVIGIINAFAALAEQTEQGANFVMLSISEALVATMIGLAVAIPAVVFFNYFKTRTNRILNDATRLGKILLAFLKDRDRKANASDLG
jgi:biopolymer transport protein ExbB